MGMGLVGDTDIVIQEFSAGRVKREVQILHRFLVPIPVSRIEGRRTLLSLPAPSLFVLRSPGELEAAISSDLVFVVSFWGRIDPTLTSCGDFPRLIEGFG